MLIHTLSSEAFLFPHRFILPTLACAKMRGEEEAEGPQRRPEEQLGSSHSVACGLSASLQRRGRRAKRPRSGWTPLALPLLPTVEFTVTKKGTHVQFLIK